MTRLERARRICDRILGLPRDLWVWKTVKEHRSLELHTPQWQASLISAFSDFQLFPEAPTYQQALLLQAAPAPLTNVLDLWLPGSGKVLSVEWDADDIRLINMRRGSWEQELFGLPEYLAKGSIGRRI